MALLLPSTKSISGINGRTVSPSGDVTMVFCMAILMPWLMANRSKRLTSSGDAAACNPPTNEILLMEGSIGDEVWTGAPGV